MTKSSLETGLLLERLSSCVWSGRVDRLGKVRVRPSSFFNERTSSSPAELTEREIDFRRIVHPNDWTAFSTTVNDFITSKGANTDQSLDFRVVHPSGEISWVRQWLLRLEPARGENSAMIVTGLLREIREERRLRWELVNMLESESTRIGREIHDDVCQVLAGIRYLLFINHQRFKDDHPTEAAQLAEILSEVEGGMDRTRALAHGLLKTEENFPTINQALRDLGKTLTVRFGISVDLQLATRSPKIDREAILHLYRIAQEAASNAFRHGGATAITINFSRQKQSYQMTVTDNGTGFADEPTSLQGVGLNIMRDRVALLNGRLHLQNCSSGGAEIRVNLPLH